MHSGQGCFVQGVTSTEDEVWLDFDHSWDGFNCELRRPEVLQCDVGEH